ncbi:unnamed protein product [Rhizoctonia solani]|uniref:F-box domain-containing protein n=1 Tax=Rhizoctonia solani TaxID=456999 RepID=A0A8H3BNF5_9AGAM|nr:unnamed protein product [Rhizoctonia solani]CAE6491184.1 unnamed protein product [Rhizoctonia solani]
MILLSSYAAKANRLPAEILSTIFINSWSTWNIDSYEPKKLFRCQLALPAVCHLWRKVALDTTALWTRVTIANNPPYDLLELFLSRSGTTLLDISVYMDNPIEDYDDESAAKSTAEDIHNFIKRHCSASRWRTLRLEVNHIYAFYILATWPFTHEATFPFLQSLDLIFTGSFSIDPHDTSLGKSLYNAHLEFSEPQAQLQLLKIRGLLSPHIFGKTFHKQLTGLVKLELHFSGKYEWYEHPRNSPAVRLLSEDPTSSDAVKSLDAPKVHMPMLTALSFLAISSPVWVLDHLLTLDAPNVATFELTFGKEPITSINGGRVAIRQLASYIATSGPIGAKRKPKSKFPSLVHFTFSSLEESFKEDMEIILAGYPRISSLALPKCSTLQPLAEAASELARLKVGLKDVTELKRFLIMRREAGTPIQTIQAVRSALDSPVEPSILKELEELVDFSLVDEADDSGDADED